MTAIKLYADEHISKRIIGSLRSKGVDILSTEEAANKGKTDIQQLNFAISEKRTIVTKDAGYFSLKPEKQHYGILFITKRKPDKEIIKHIMSVLELLGPEEAKGSVIYI